MKEKFRTWGGFLLTLLLILLLGGTLLFLAMKNLAPLQEKNDQLKQSWPQ